MNDTERDFAQFIEDWLLNLGIEAGMTQATKMLILVAVMFVIAGILWAIGQQFINRVVHRLARRTKTDMDDYLMDKGFFNKLGHIIPVVVISGLAPVAFSDYPAWVPYIERVTDGFNILIILRAINALINGVGSFLTSTPKYRDKPVASFTQLSKILVWLIGILILGAVVLGENPLVAFTALGAASAVLLFVFKDAILGFIASIQLTVNDMIRLGDWVSLPKYSADGNIIEINLTTVKVSNWDKTISTVPTYAFVADGVTNWRGMEEGGGRRIKRAVKLKISSVKLCTDEMLDRFSKIELVRDHIARRREEIDRFNKEHKADTAASVVNGRRMTNLGILRAYIEAYVRRNPNINQEMTCMVRQMESTNEGVALEVYCFSKEKAWITYEGIQADIFDHILAIIPHFDLDVFESPASSDLNGMKVILRGDTA